MEQPQIWHHGLVARAWAEFEIDGGQEAVYYKRLIETSRQPALDLGCGSGRLLLPYLQAGLDVDGCDYSQDMLAQCEARTRSEGLSPQLYAQAMHDLDLPRRYRTMERSLLADGTELEIAARTVAVDPLDESQIRQVRARLWRNGELLEEQVHTQRYEEYGKHELLLVLEQAGFRDIQIFGDFSDEPATANHNELIFMARK